MKAEEQHDRLVDLDTVESVLAYLARFGCAQGCMPSHGFTCCAQFGGCCSEKGGPEPEE